LSLLAGIAVIYSRYGILALGQLDGVLHSTAGAGFKSLTTAAILIGLAVVVRAAVWPFHAWQTGTLGAPPAAIVMVVGTWPLLAGSVLIRTLPIINGAGPQARTAIALALGVGVLVSTLYALVNEGARMALVLAGTGAVGLTLLAILGGSGVSASMAALLAVGIGRGAAQLALGSITSGLRSDRLQELGGAWTRLPRASAALLLSVAAMMAATAAALASRPLPWPNWLAAIGLGLTAISLGALYALVSHGLLRRRRTFDPTRVREASGLVWVAALVPAALALLAAGLVHWTAWTRFVTQDASPPNIPRELAWVALAAVLAVIGGFILSRPPRRLCIELWRLGALVTRAWGGAVGLLRRFGAEPVLALARAFETQALGRAGFEIGSALRAVGEFGSPLPEAPLKQNQRSHSGRKPRS
ncbi:MAG: proton-conducting transporter membrane subunit, partial [Candidatus Dormibacteraceae bacterium]